ncbi:hypothetical protein J6590_076347 [Homalodisca vitripennis]|nr:hypothetical protein J6590_076347 [Homalodisca vitripennis]
MFTTGPVLYVVDLLLWSLQRLSIGHNHILPDQRCVSVGCWSTLFFSNVFTTSGTLFIYFYEPTEISIGHNHILPDQRCVSSLQRLSIGHNHICLTSVVSALVVGPTLFFSNDVHYQSGTLRGSSTSIEPTEIVDRPQPYPA